jgi:hypothetical protein
VATLGLELTKVVSHKEFEVGVTGFIGDDYPLIDEGS